MHWNWHACLILTCGNWWQKEWNEHVLISLGYYNELNELDFEFKSHDSWDLIHPNFTTYKITHKVDWAVIELTPTLSVI